MNVLTKLRKPFGVCRAGSEARAADYGWSAVPGR